MQLEVLLRCPQEPASGLYPESVDSIQDAILILLFHPLLSSLSFLFHSGFRTKILYAFLICPLRATCIAGFIPFALIIVIIFIWCL